MITLREEWNTEEKEKRKREYWAQAFPDWKYLLLITIVPERIDVLIK